CVVVRHEDAGCDMVPHRDIWWENLAPGGHLGARVPETPATTPCMIMYTSGTSGRPKGAVHTHAGFPINAAHDLAACCDLQRADALFWLTDLGWMMGPWLIFGGLTRGSTIVLLEGSPDHPTPGRLWEMVERHRITVFGVAPTAIRALIPSGTAPVEAADRS